MYSGSKMKPADMLKIKVKERFGIDVSQSNITFVDLGPEFAAKIGP